VWPNVTEEETDIRAGLGGFEDTGSADVVGEPRFRFDERR